jgi:hypothetical protein
MKKILCALLMLCLLVPAALAEETTLNWETAAQILEAGNVTGEFHTFDEIAVKIWLPEGMLPVELTEEDKENGYISNWDGTWSHFGCEPHAWDKIDYLQIKLTDENREFVLIELRKIHVPGEIADDIVTVYGYRTDVDYL